MNILSSKSDIITSLMQSAQQWADNRSKDPDTKVGAIVYDDKTGSTFHGYNGFPRDVPDTDTLWQRPTKYLYVRHAEENAIIKSLLAIGRDVSSCTLICTHEPCHRCMGLIAQVGIKTIHYMTKYKESDDQEAAKRTIIESCNIQCLQI